MKWTLLPFVTDKCGCGLHGNCCCDQNWVTLLCLICCLNCYYNSTPGGTCHMWICKINFRLKVHLLQWVKAWKCQLVTWYLLSLSLSLSFFRRSSSCVTKSVIMSLYSLLSLSDAVVMMMKKAEQEESRWERVENKEKTLWWFTWSQNWFRLLTLHFLTIWL